jgi:hypothetical protein
MKKIFAVALLLMSLGSVALADGSGLPPTPVKPNQIVVIELADGSGLPPAKTSAGSIAA